MMLQIYQLYRFRHLWFNFLIKKTSQMFAMVSRIVVSDDAASVTGSRRAVNRWLGAFQNINRRRSKEMDELERVDSV